MLAPNQTAASLMGNCIPLDKELREELRRTNISASAHWNIRRRFGGFSVRQSRLITLVQTEVARFYGQPLSCMTSRDKHRTSTWPRQVAMMLSYEFGLGSLKDIGRAFKRDHGTVISSTQTVNDLSSVYPEVRAELAALRSRLEGKIK